jgi:hypothetical protein
VEDASSQRSRRLGRAEHLRQGATHTVTQSTNKALGLLPALQHTQGIRGDAACTSHHSKRLATALCTTRTSVKWPGAPAPLLAMTGMLTADDTAWTRGRSKPCREVQGRR